MPDLVIESIVQEKLDVSVLIKWLNNEPFKDTPEDCILHCCSRSEFVDCFLSYLREQTDSILQTNSNAVQLLHSTPEKLSTRRKHRRSVSDPTETSTDPRSVQTHKKHDTSPVKDKKRTGRRVKTKLFTDDKSNHSMSSDESRISTGLDRIVISTPMKADAKNDFQILPLASPVTAHSKSFKEFERCDTPRLSHRLSKSQDKSVSLGDYLVSATKTKKKRNSKNVSNEETEKVELDLSSSEAFPEIGARKSTSLRSETRRIKPTIIDKSLSQKSMSLNSFNSESFQQPSPLAYEENSAFTQQKIQAKSSQSYDVERNFLKQERHKLMEKFNILNQSSPKPVTPQIKIMKRESVDKTQNYIEADSSKVLFKNKIDNLVQIYDVLLSNNLIVSVNTELYFMMSILLSKQVDEDYNKTDTKLNDNNFDYLLRSIHNSTYFAVKSLWNQKSILEVILDKNSLKVLGENKKVRGFYPELAKFLLNSYGLKCEAESNLEPSNLPPAESKPVVICFNFETDNVDNFPSMMSFQNFKKQRDMFYEIFRWYQDSMASARAALRTRVKALLAGGQGACNHAHLASLFMRHMLAECLRNTQESKLSKLHRRLTCPSANETYRLPHFSAKEMFYKEFIMCAESEAFRAHLRDALATEVGALDGAPSCADDTPNGCTPELRTSFLSTSKKLALLGKFLGLLVALPYCQSSDKLTQPVKPKVVENCLALRDYSQPNMDLKSLLLNANAESRLTITIPWIIHYLSVLDHTTLRIKYYKQLIKILYSIHNNLKQENLKKNTIIYIKSVLGWLYDLPHFPREFIHDPGNIEASDVRNIDNVDIIDESIIFELCPYLREVNSLLATCRVSNERESFRHITPVSLAMNSEDRLRNKEKELQLRLEEEYFKSLPSSTRRVAELVCERVCSVAARRLGALVAGARETAREEAREMVAKQCTISMLQAHYTSSYKAFLSRVSNVQKQACTALRAALTALLPNVPSALEKALKARCMRYIEGYVRSNYGSSAIICSDIEAEYKTLLSLCENPTNPTTSHATPTTSHAPTTPTLSHKLEINADTELVSVASIIIQMKEACNSLLCAEHGCARRLGSALAAARGGARSPRGSAAAARALCRLSVDLCVICISRKPEEVTDSLLDQFFSVWDVCAPPRPSPPKPTPPSRPHTPPPRDFSMDDRAPTPDSDEENTKITKFIIANNTQELNELKQKFSKNNKSPIEKCPVQSLGGSCPSSKNINSPNTKSSNIKNLCISPTIKSPVINSPGLNSPNLRSPGLNSPGLNSPGLNSPGLNSPNLKNPGLNSPNLNSPSLNSPNLNSPNLNSPNLNSPGLNSPYQEENLCGDELVNYFERILCARNIVLLDRAAPAAWDALAALLLRLLRRGLLAEEALAEQCLAVYRQDWPQGTLCQLSRCVRAVCARWRGFRGHKLALFLRFLAEYCADEDSPPRC